MTYDTSMIGHRIKEARSSLGITKTRLAEMCDIQQYQTVTAWETGNSVPSLSKLFELCSILKCDIGYLLGEYEERTRVKAELCNESGLTEAAAHKLLELNNGTDIGKQYLNFYSAFITDFSIFGMLSTLPGLIHEIETEGLDGKQECVFQNKEEALRFYQFQMQECIMQFIRKYFANEDFIYLGK